MSTLYIMEKLKVCSGPPPVRRALTRFTQRPTQLFEVICQRNAKTHLFARARMRKTQNRGVKCQARRNSHRSLATIESVPKNRMSLFTQVNPHLMGSSRVQTRFDKGRMPSD